MNTPLRPPLKSDLHNPGRQTRINRFMGIAHTGSGNINIFALPGDAQAKVRNRQRMLERVKRFWVQGVLDQSVHNAVLLQVPKQERPDAVQHRPWDLVLETGLHSRLIPPDKPIIDIFAQAGRALLVLGPPGSGKTITMLELCRESIRLAEADPACPIPVVFNLSSWAQRQRRLRDWILDELNLKYQVPKKVGEEWIENNEFLLLLDGIDEVKKEKRDVCTEAINKFRQNEYGLMDIVIAGRTDEYEALSTKLTLNTAIVILPLDLGQIQRYLTALGPEMSHLCKALEEDAGLRKLAESPLMLSVMALTYCGTHVDSMAESFSLEEHRHRIFENYIERMFRRLERSPGAGRYTPQQTIDFLKWIARAMSQHAQSELFIEDIQPTWLPTAADRLLYKVAIRLAGVLMLILCTVLLDIMDIFWLGRESLYLAIRQGLVFGSAFAIAFLLGSLFRLRFSAIPASLLSVIAGSLVIAFFQPIPPSHSIAFALAAGLFTLPSVLAGTWVAKTETTIELVEVFPWSWTWLATTLKRGRGFLAFTVLLMLGINLLTRPRGIDAWFIASRLLSLVLACFLGVAIAGAIARREVPKLRTHPSQGIWRSLRNAICVGAAVMTLVFGWAWLLLPREKRVLTAWEIAVNLGLFAGFFLGGGAACIKHLMLRVLLGCKRYTPWNLKRFFEHCVERIFLQKVGGGYLFIHRMLLDYFAGLSTATELRTGTDCGAREQHKRGAIRTRQTREGQNGFDGRAAKGDRTVADDPIETAQGGHKTTITHTTTVGSVVGQVHTGSGNIEVGSFAPRVEISSNDEFVAVLRELCAELEVARNHGFSAETVESIRAEIAAVEQEAKQKTPEASSMLKRLENARSFVVAATNTVTATAAAAAATGKLVSLLETAIKAIRSIF
jgi:hypothetical protein